MKRLILSIALLLPVALFVSCSDDDSYAKVAFETIPSSAKTFVNAHFNESDVKYCVEYPCGYEVRMINNTEMRFKITGEWMKIDMHGNVLPQSIALLISPKIINYVSSHYPTHRIEEIEKKEINGVLTYIEVELNNDIEITFTLDGDLVRDKGGQGGKSEILKPEMASLPTPAQTLLTTHFAGIAIVKIERDKVEYEVDLADGTEVEFDLDGVFKSVEVEVAAGVPTAMMLPEIVSYLSANHASRVVDEYSKLSPYYKGEYAGGYEVELRGGPELKLYFSATGTFLSSRL